MYPSQKLTIYLHYVCKVDTEEKRENIQNHNVLNHLR